MLDLDIMFGVAMFILGAFSGVIWNLPKEKKPKGEIPPKIYFDNEQVAKVTYEMIDGKEHSYTYFERERKGYKEGGDFPKSVKATDGEEVIENGRL